jgi:dystonin
MKTLDVYEPKVKFLLLNGESLLAKTPETATTGLRQNLDDLKTRWENIQSAVGGRRGHLEDALKTAENFQDSLNRAMTWLTEVERTISNLKPVSRVLSTLQEQRQELKVRYWLFVRCIT